MDNKHPAREEPSRQPEAIAARRESPALVQRMLEAQQRERQLITAELVKMKGLMPLLMRRRNGGRWTAEERRQLVGQLQAIANLSPYLVVLVLPGSFFALPVLAWWLDRRRLERGGNAARGGAQESRSEI